MPGEIYVSGLQLAERHRNGTLAWLEEIRRPWTRESHKVAPRDEHYLTASIEGKVTVVSPSLFTLTVTARTPYAAVQEKGYRITDGGRRIVFRRYTTPGTGKHYLKGPFMRHYRTTWLPLGAEIIAAHVEGRA